MSPSKVKIWFPFMIGDQLGRTQHLTNSEFGAYVRLQMHQWQNGHFTEDQIRIIARFDPDAWSISQASIMHMLSRDEAGLYFLPWLDEQLSKSTEKQKKAVEKAQKAANSRWAKKRQSNGEQGTKPMLQASSMHSSSNAPDVAKAMPVIVRGNTLPPSQAQGDPPAGGGGEGSAKTTKRPAKASENSQATQPANGASGHAGGAKRGTQSQVSESVMVRQAEARNPTNGDPRFLPFKGVLRRWWGEANGVPADRAPWGGRTDAELKRCLQAEPHLCLEDVEYRLVNRWNAMERCLEHPPRRGAVIAAAPLDQVIRRLSTFSNGPVTDLGDPI